ncbi:MAG TPA: pantoate--beta-alanine ligase [Anaerolineales bacterium]|nr:pantoate--beta-alanine ligase [Anaerolineales bacterium]
MATGRRAARQRMKQVVTLGELRQARADLKGPVGFVPTMGFLHEGHISLVKLARQDCASVVVSIFVNPAQFGSNEDLAAYPRDLTGDLSKLEAAGVDLVWLPTPDLVYPAGYNTWVNVEGVSQPLEGAARPGHFRGVATVVSKLFNAVQPQKAYFGQKDAQQVAVIKQMVRDLNFPIDIVVVPTLREADGLAMSSRNTYLSPDERKAAAVLFRSLQAAKQAYAAGERDAEALRNVMHATLEAEPLAMPIYVSCADPGSLLELQRIEHGALLSMAVRIGKTRLIDNIQVFGA